MHTERVGLLAVNEHEREIPLFEVLPYSSEEKYGPRFKKCLDEYLFLVTATINSLELLKKGELSCFDPLVGENACQLRAFINAYIFSQVGFDVDTLLVEAHRIKEEIKALDDSIFSRVQNLSLRDFIKQSNFDVKLNSIELFLVQSYLLTEVKHTKAPKPEIPYIKNEYTDIKKIKTLSPIGTAFAEKLVKNLRASVSSFTVEFLQALASDLPDTIFEKISEKFVINHGKLQCLPCFWSTMVTALGALRAGIPIALRVQLLALDSKVTDEILLFYDPTSKGFKLCDPHSLDSESPAIILIGNSSRKSGTFSPESLAKELERFTPVDLLLSYAAAHPQYPGNSLDFYHPDLQEERFVYYKSKAREWGCCLENPSLFFLAHAYCEKVSSFIKKHSSKAVFIPNEKELQIVRI